MTNQSKLNLKPLSVYDKWLMLSNIIREDLGFRRIPLD